MGSSTPYIPFSEVSDRHRLRMHAGRASDEFGYRRWSLTREGRANRRRLRQLRARFAGRRAVVMGNGPSLLKSDVNALGGDVTIVSNAHYLIWDQLDYRPTFLTVEDPLVAEDRAEELSLLDGVTTVFPYEFRTLLGPASPARIYINLLRRYLPFPQFSRRFASRVYWGGTVSFVNLQLAHYLACNPIYMIGFDHFYVVPADRESELVIRSQQADVNHIHPDYFGPGYRWHDPSVPRMEAAYRCARAALEREGVRVVNATVGGRLEVFDRVEPGTLTSRP